MSFTDKINTDLKEAMKAQDQKALRAIRAIKAAILLANTDGSGKEVDDEKAIQILQKLVKQRRESLDIYEKQGREDLAVVERDEIAVIEKYLPAQLDEASLRTILQELIVETGASGPKDMGKVIGAASKKLAGQADGKTISLMVKQLLETN
ncbi:MAG: GatB/YqeY domain-containing protein [Saprospiraceae bacterium]|nr:GatB/YqeY domain-containing protein [Saprospiraceae bacterium]MBK8451097.1 GatB/YqeY domain-containing protein [Saprospiraceae bacterium]MBK9220576.1 GatB/YqeY domain-containing protein [Saprospiraceae bacterium]MBK9722576.1 GatB/YqeY domain-containing protein [Saprospiraceae bacterium]